MTEAATGRRTSVLALAAALGVTAAVLVGLLAPDPSREGPAAGNSGGAGSVEPTAAPVRPARPLATAVTPEAPRAARLPSGTVVPIRAVSTGPDGELAVPGDVRTAGWWRGGSRIGDPFGATLVAAHVDSRSQGLGPYVELLRARAGQRVVLRSATLRQVFRVRSLRLVPQGSLAGRAWIFGAGGARRLTLVTCAPPYDVARGGYQQLAVVTAVPVGPPVRRHR